MIDTRALFIAWAVSLIHHLAECDQAGTVTRDAPEYERDGWNVKNPARLIETGLPDTQPDGAGREQLDSSQGRVTLVRTHGVPPELWTHLIQLDYGRAIMSC